LEGVPLEGSGLAGAVVEGSGLVVVEPDGSGVEDVVELEDALGLGEGVP
jgi:hypothetical protein